MLKNRPASTSTPTAGNQQLKLLVLVLVLSNIILGLLSVFLLRSLNRDYSLLIDDSVPTMNHIRSIGKEANETFRAVIMGLVNDDPAVCAMAIQRAQHALESEKKNRARVFSASILQEKPALLAELRQTGEAYEQMAASLISRITPNTTTEDERIRINQIQQTVDHYSIVVGKALDFVESHSRTANGTYSKSVRLRSALMIVLASWPVLVAGLVVTLTVVVVSILLLLFKQADAGDEP